MTENGQITIPEELRAKLGFTNQVELIMAVESGRLVISSKATRTGKGARMIEHMRGKGSGKLSTDEIMKMTRGEE